MPKTKLQRRTETLPFTSTAEKAIRQLRAPLVELFGAPFGRLTPGWAFSNDFLAYPAVEIADAENEYTVTAEVPGLKKEDISIDYDDGVLTIAGEKKEEVREEDKKYYLFERCYGSFERSFTLPNSVDGDKITAKVSDGVLTIHLPKLATAASSSKKIEIGEGK